MLSFLVKNFYQENPKVHIANLLGRNQLAGFFTLCIFYIGSCNDFIMTDPDQNESTDMSRGVIHVD